MLFNGYGLRQCIGFGDGVGLRGGTFHTDYGAAWTTTLTDCAFAQDVTVNGTAVWEVYGSFTADLIVSGSGTAGGTLHVEGTWQAAGPSAISKSAAHSAAKRWPCWCQRRNHDRK